MKTLKAAYLLNICLCSAFLVVGCDKSTTETDNLVEETQQSSTSYMPVSLSSSEFSKMGAVGVLQNMGEIEQSQKDCLNNIDDNFAASELDKYFKENYSDAELKTLNDYFGSDLGKKVSRYVAEQVMQSFGGEAPDQSNTPTEEELMEVAKISQDPSFVKYNQFTMSQGEGSLQELIKPLLIEEFEKCGIDTVRN